MKRLLMLAFWAFFTSNCFALAQDNQAIVESEPLECEKIFSEPPFVGLGRDQLTRFDSRKLGKNLLGKTCSRDVLISFFETRGWKLLVELEEPLSNVGRDYVEANHRFTFCRQSPIPLRWLPRGECDATIGIYLLNGKFVDLFGGAIK